ncbi:hypothetical protein [Microvirga arabica]|uniref:hypothetical protein n=1 Tax=Microvirga arabica TaxID=1128671 RepID=UPI0019398137|nr:hypothetical protein [Microvirga arabica]MBM1173053.1 hypothetical protein [Microvirga arabica]
MNDLLAKIRRKIGQRQEVGESSDTIRKPDVRMFFAGDWYLETNPDVKAQEADPLDHYLQFGWKEGRNPTPNFSVKGYLASNPDVAASGLEPFTHYIEFGLREGRPLEPRSASSGRLPSDFDHAYAFHSVQDQTFPLAAESLDGSSDIIRKPDVRMFFAGDWYLETNPDVKAQEADPLDHYLQFGWKEGRNPTPNFSVKGYLASNPDVAASGLEPFTHYIEFGLREGRPLEPRSASSGRLPSDFDHAYAFHSVQDQTFPLAAESAENVMVILIPEHNTMSGGIYSFFSIAKTVYNLRFKHEYFVLLMTRPTRSNVTYTRQKNFRNSEDVFRFEQLQRCRAAKTVYIHIPEYAAPGFVRSIDHDMMHYLRSRERLFVNILNQKTDIMPEKEDFTDLRSIADGISQSVAHHAYFSQKFADKYDLPTLLLPAYTDLSGYEPLSFQDKDKLIIYSPDDSPWRESTLARLREHLPDYTLREIRDVTFDEYMDLATRCRFSITFGEGFDGYLAQPIHQGGVGFAVYNDEFFPSPDMLHFKNIFSSGEDMENNIVDRIKYLENSYSAYQSANKAMIDLYHRLYSKEDYIHRVLKLIRRDFEYYPLHMTSHSGIRL